MEPAVVVALAWVVFAGTHVGLAVGRVRASLVERLGKWGFIALFSAVAAITFVLLIRTYAEHRFSGAAGLALGSPPALRAVLLGVVAVGMMFVIASLDAYPHSPMALVSSSVHEPRGLERITRHGFFVGVALIGGAHVLLATRLVGAVFAIGLVALSIVGAWHQDRKLLSLRGAAYARYVELTSAIPFAAIAAGRQQLVWRELPLRAAAIGLALTFLLRAVHESIFAHGGLWVVLVTLGGAAIATLRAHRAERRRELSPAAGTQHPVQRGVN
jgi:uncharacterized membrane protein